MKVLQAEGDVKWAGQSDAVDIAEVEMKPFVIPLDPAVGSGLIETSLLPLEMNLTRVTTTFSDSMCGQIFPLVDVDISFPENVFSVKSARRGRVVEVDYMTEGEYTYSDNFDLFQFSDQKKFLPQMDTSQPAEVIMLKVGWSTLCKLIGVETGNKILEGLNLKDSPSAEIVEVPPKVRALLHESFSNHFHSEVNILFQQSRVLEYLCTLATFLTGVSNNEPKVTQEKKIRRLHQQLLSLDGGVPTMDTLACQYGLSARTLNNQFKIMYKESIFSFISKQRLRLAKELLVRDGMPIKVISHSLGYRHVSHFTSAFRKEYDVTPSVFRRNLE